uniref:Uncharacterized protein n=1 Tax=Physcomitrium patens TaxID=3218 RepID=A0A2K1IFP1_PHYPA|nr:hypothetical protein PHYPA_028680 [Physcomitrium patens]
MKFLNDDQALKLFLNYAFFGFNDENFLLFKNEAHDIIKSCSALSLSFEDNKVNDCIMHAQLQYTSIKDKNSMKGNK